jgi:PAS domain S-box-containing protein
MVWVTNPQGSHEWFSQRWYDFTGLTEEESLGAGWKNPFHEDDMPATVQRWSHSLATGEEYNTEYRCRRRDGKWIWMLGRALPLRDEDGRIVRWFGTCTDIHEAVESRETARRYREQLLQVLDTAKITLLSIDKQRRITVIEGNLESQKSLEPFATTKDFIGQDLDEFFVHYAGGPLPQADMTDIQAVLDGKSTDAMTEFKSTITERWFRIRFLPLTKVNRNGGVEGDAYVDGTVGVLADTTELRAREQDLKQQEEANAKLSANALAAKEASRMKSQFLANMSHEIRTPIAGVIGMSDLLLDTELGPEQKDYTENIQRSANGLLTVINDILDFSKVESGRLDIEEVPFSLHVVLRDINKMLSFAATRKNLSFQRKISPVINQDLRVLGDPGRLRQILQNLLTNSMCIKGNLQTHADNLSGIKFTSEGSVTLSARVKSEEADTLVCEFAVQDTGIGIEEDVRKKLFRPFSQADSSTARRYGGTGLGLTISKNLVELMKGEIHLESTLGVGTRAWFTIPFKKTEYADKSSPLIELEPLPDRLTGSISMSVSGNSDPGTSAITMNGPPSPSQSRANDGSVLSFGNPDQDTLTAAERKSINVLVVEV